ncbi:MAG: 1-deoxy-D-xylulose-5-phosphate reductoisomerase [Holosporales bacterium]|jgi:1-deoxy-D-xylulose-5-phosphate reductoisomerase|nr:1-deoxy-D-xylulose-5-phosphate reductoisomerase [Holosporales bacterium]
MKKINIFGSTGSVGSKAIEIAHQNGFEILGITGNVNHKKLIEQARKYTPKYVCVFNKDSFEIVRDALNDTGIKVLPESEIGEIAKLKVDCCVMAISGNSGLLPTFLSVENAKRLAIATKEVIISGGNVLIELAKLRNTEIIPIDSEHNAIFQCLIGEDRNSISELLLTASGGPFVNFEEEALKEVTLKDVLKHPNWIMGKKITVDSATLLNKALEIIEAAYLFKLPIDKIGSLIHTNSIIHGMARFADGSLKAAISTPDMKLPISYAINYPHRKGCNLKNLLFEELEGLMFKKKKDWQIRNMDLAYTAFRESKVISFNVANEIAVSDFISGKIKFNEIYKVVREILENSEIEKVNSFEDIVMTIECVKRRRGVVQ